MASVAEKLAAAVAIGGPLPFGPPRWPRRGTQDAPAMRSAAVEGLPRLRALTLEPWLRKCPIAWLR
jgi:hypothetical protein